MYIIIIIIIIIVTNTTCTVQEIQQVQHITCAVSENGDLLCYSQVERLPTEP